jgi:voltage-gated sodium channel
MQQDALQNALNQPGWRGQIERFMARPFIQRLLITLIVVNAGILGLETNPEIMGMIGTELIMIDHAILWIFIAEIVLLIAARGWRFFKDPWCVFDFLVVAIALVPATGSLSVLRALRVLRILRLINKIESMRRVVSALLGSLPGLGSVFGLVLIVFYVSGVIATNMYASEFPERFGTLGMSFYTLFQVMTLEGWSEEIARPIMAIYPSAWIFFLIFIFISTFIVVNLFVAVIVDSINSIKHHEETKGNEHKEEDIAANIRALRLEIAELKAMIKSNTNDTR